jgi:transposase InsO family protein
MGVTVQFESHRNELAVILELEHDPEVLAYYDQPPPIPLEYLSRTHRRVRVLHTPDFFVVRTDGAYWLECKAEKKLRELECNQPNRFRHEDGGWRCPPGEIYAAGFGLGYRVRSSDEIDWTFQANIEFLEDYLRGGSFEIPEWAAKYLSSLVLTKTARTLGEWLAFAGEAGIGSDLVYLLLLTDRVYVDLAAARLSEPDRVLLFPTREDAPADRAEIVPEATPMLSRTDTIRELAVRCGPRDLALASERKAALEGAGDSISSRTRRRWMAQFKKAQDQLGDGYLGLLPKVADRGNRKRRLSPETIELTERFIREKYENVRRPNLHSVWIQLTAACRDAGVPAPCYSTLREIALHRPVLERERARSGKRGAYPLEPFVYALERTTPRHGERPFHIGHLDHTELDLELVCSVTGQNLGRPWLSLLTDAYSRRTLAYVLSFESPSYRTCMRITRECVKRFQRLPSVLVTDGGRELLGRYFQSVLARYEIVRKVRPPGESRFGSVCERLFGMTNTRFLHNLLGNTQLSSPTPRLATGSRNPKRQAVWTFESLNRFLRDFLYEVHDRLEHPALGQTPEEAFRVGMAAAGQGVGKENAHF